MTVDVSVIMPAYRAGATIERAVASVFAQEGVTAEVVLCADDEVDYGSLLPPELRATAHLTFCRTPSPRSGPSVARNIALRHARADIIACLDADDAYGPDRLVRLLPLVVRHGVATGPTRAFGECAEPRPRRLSADTRPGRQANLAGAGARSRAAGVQRGPGICRRGAGTRECGRDVARHRSRRR